MFRPQYQSTLCAEVLAMLKPYKRESPPTLKLLRASVGPAGLNYIIVVAIFNPNIP
jgi:hypothetical protein